MVRKGSAVSNGSGVAITAYRGGFSGTELAPLADTITLTSLTAAPGECTKEVVVLISNANPAAFNFVGISATDTGTPGSSGECSPEI